MSFSTGQGVAVSARMNDRNSIGLDQDWKESKLPPPVPVCKKVFIVTALFHQGSTSADQCAIFQGIGFL